MNWRIIDVDNDNKSGKTVIENITFELAWLLSELLNDHYDYKLFRVEEMEE
jgi:hypothetical protein